MFSEEKITSLYTVEHPKEISDEVHMKNVDMLLELRQDIQRKVESADVTKTCLGILRGMAYLSVAFSNERIAIDILDMLGYPEEVYDKKLDSIEFFRDYFNPRFMRVSEDADFSAGDFVGCDEANTFVGLLSNLCMICFSEYVDEENIGLYNQAATQRYFNNLIEDVKDDFSLVGDELFILLADLQSQISPYRKAIEMVAVNAQISNGTRYLLAGETGYDDAFSLEVSRGVTRELWEYLEKKYEQYLSEAHAAKFVGDDLTVTQVAKVLNASGARVYQLLDEGKIEAIPKGDERNTTNKMLVSLESVKEYVDGLVRAGKVEARYLCERLMPFGHLEVEFLN